MPASDTQDPLASRDTLDLQDCRPNLLHFALIVAGFLGKLSPLLLIPTWFALAVIACWPWQDLRFVIAVSSLAFICADGVSLALLPQAGRSFGPVTPPLLALAIVRTGVTLGIGLLWKTRVGLVLALGINLALLLVSIYATWVEPFRVGVTWTSLRSPKLNGDLRCLP